MVRVAELMAVLRCLSRYDFGDILYLDIANLIKLKSADMAVVVMEIV